MQNDAPQSSGKPVPSAASTERRAILVVMALVFLYAAWSLREPEQAPRQPEPERNAPATALTAEMIPLVSGEESIVEIFTKAGCPVCHVIPGVPGANGQVGPPLLLGTTGPQRLVAASYTGTAKTVHEYVVESVVEPNVYVVPGYPERTMPTWYGSKLSALALQKIANYLEQQTDPGGAK
jgi:hypothetical protein